MNEKVKQTLQKGKEIAMPVCIKAKALALQGYAKGNELMDKVSFLKSTTNKLIAWGVIGVLSFLAVLMLFSGGDSPETAFREMGYAFQNKDVNGFLSLMYNEDGDASLDKAGEWKELAEKKFKEMMEESKDLGKWMSTAKIISIKEHGDKATIKFRPSDAKEWKEMKDEGVIGMKMNAIKSKGRWKLDIGTFEPIMRN